MRPPIHSKKHYVQESLMTITAGAVDTNIMVNSLESPTAVADVVEGALVKAIFIERWVRTNDTAPGSFVAILVKHSGGVNDPSAAEMAALGDWNNKKNILYTTQGLSNVTAQSAIPFLRQWIKIPKGKQRMGLGDTIRLHIFAQALDQNICGFATYKEYT